MRSSRLNPVGLAPCIALAFAVVGSAQPPQAKREELKYAVVVTRHGVRSPTWTLERLNQYSAAPWPDFGVAPGELTPHGRALMKLMGVWYREDFATEGLPGFARDAGCPGVFFHSDTAQRTMLTAQALAESILPGCPVEIHSAGKDKDGKEKADPLFEGTGTPDSAMSMAAVAGRLGATPEAVADAHRPALDLLARLLSGNGKAAHSIFEEPVSLAAGKNGVAMNGPLSLASTLTEDLFLEYADGMSGDRLGWGRLTSPNLLELMSLHTAYADLLRRTPYLARARGSNLLNYIAKSLEQAASGKPVAGAGGPPATTLLVISGHDTNLSNLSGILGLSWQLPGYQADDAPPGGALIFTLWRSADTNRLSVRLQFVAQTPEQLHDAAKLSLASSPALASVFVPACSTASAGYLCDWESFSTTVRAAILPELVSR